MLGQTKNKQSSSTLPSNRTQEQYELEQEFQPLFDFLEAKDKDWRKVESYSVSVTQYKGEEDIWQWIEMHKNDKREFTGNYKYNVNKTGLSIPKLKEEANTYPIRIVDNRIEYISGQPNIYFKDSLFTYQVTKTDIQKLSIKHLLVDHPETSIKNIYYNLENKSLYEMIVKSLGMTSIESGTLDITKNGKEKYSLGIRLSDGKKMVYIIYQINFSN